MLNWFLDFEAYQIGGKFFPVEICLVNGETKACNLFYVRYNFMHCSPTTTFQLKKHGIHWDEGNVTLRRALKAILNRVQMCDIIFVKGDQKRVFLLQFVWFDRKVEEIICSSSIRDLVQMCCNEACSKHYNSNNLSCARHKCFALASFFDNVLCA